jgi:hypothetical protein
MKRVVQILLFTFFFNGLYSEEVIIDLNDFIYLKNFEFSEIAETVIYKELRFKDHYAEGIVMNGYSSVFIKSDTGYVSEPSVKIGARGIKRHGGFSVLEIKPFFVRNDSLFFITSIDYSLTGYKYFPPNMTLKSLSYDKIDMTIITTERFAGNFEKYKSFKTKQGFQTVIKTIEEIYKEYPGNNNSVKIRNYIKDLYIQNDLEFVLIGGGYNVIPTGEALPYISPETSYIATDAIYSCLDEDPDYYADVYVGRFPGNAEVEIDAVINKTIKYYSFPRNFRDGFNTSLFLAGFNVNMTGDGIRYCEKVKSEFPDYFAADSMYEGITDDFTHQNMLSRFDAGYNFVYSQSHGDLHLIRQIDNNFKIWSDQIYNTGAVSGLYFIAACESGNIGRDSFSRKAMISPRGGCVNYIGSGGAEFPAISADANAYFFKGIFENKSIGESLANSIIVYGNIAYNGYARYLAMAYAHQGDPSNKPFLREPEKVDFSSLELFKRGSGTVSGNFDTALNDTVFITVTAGGRIISKTKTKDTDFKIIYDNLNSDSVSVHFYSQEVLLKTYNYATVPAGEIEFQVSEIRAADENKSGVIEHGEKFGLKFDFKTYSNISGIDSLSALITKVSSSGISVKNGKAKFSVPEAGSSVNLNIFDMNYLSEDPYGADSVAVIDFEIQRKDGKVLFSKKLFVPTAVPHLILQSVKWNNDSIRPEFLNTSKGTINSAEIEIIEDKKTADPAFNNSLPGVNPVVLKNIEGYKIVSDSVSFRAKPSKIYSFSITINGDRTYYSDRISLNSVFYERIKLYGDYSTGKVNLEWDNYSESGPTYNVYSSDKADFAVSEQRNFEKLTINKFSFNYFDHIPIYVRIAFVDPSGIEYFISNTVRIEPVSLYGNTTYELAPFRLYDPVYVDGKLISNSQNSSIAGIYRNGDPVNGTGLIHKADANGFSGTAQQGYAIGDVDGDGSNDMVSYSYNTGDSVLVKVVNLNSGIIIAQRKIYGFVMENAPVLVNADSDKQLEILISVFNGNINGSPKGSFIYLLDLDGNELKIADGFPIYSNYSSYSVHSPSLLDLNNDGSKELIFNCGSRIIIYSFENLTKVIEYELPKTIQTSLSFCDINEDGNIEIFALTESYGSYGKLFCYNFDGTSLIEKIETAGGINADMKPYDFYDLTPPVNFADIDDDGTIEIIVLTASKLYIFDNQFDNYPNFPISLDKRVTKNSLSAPSMADLDGDGSLDILFADHNSRIWCYSGRTGKILSGFPIQIFDLGSVGMTAPAVADLDGDGSLEFAVGVNDGVMQVYDYPYQSSNRPAFDKYRGDSCNSGLFQPLLPEAPQNVKISCEGSVLRITWNCVANAASYRIYSSDNPHGDFIYEAETSETNYFIGNISLTKKYYYIKAVK